MKTADLIFDRLSRWGVSVVFGLPGDGINGLVEALRQRQDQIRFIQVRHEELPLLISKGASMAATGTEAVGFLHFWFSDFGLRICQSNRVWMCSRYLFCEGKSCVLRLWNTGQSEIQNPIPNRKILRLAATARLPSLRHQGRRP